ncbi:hypothetical protein ACHAP5_007517 [Fusarium lateritium]
MTALLLLLPLALTALAITYKALSILYNVLFSPLKNVPGPILARFTDLWYVNRVRKGQFERDNIALHRKYGPIVRYGPNRYSFNHPEAAQIIYGVGKADKFAKSSFYRAFTTPNPDQPSFFAHEHIKEYAQLRRLYQSTHAMSALISYEDFVDECSDLLISGSENWLVVQHPQMFSRLLIWADEFTERLMKEHQAKPKSLDLEDEDKQRLDFLSKYAARHRKDPSTYNAWYVLSGCASNMTGGSDTTGISLSAIMHFLMLNPKVAYKLREEVVEHQSRAAHPRHFSFKETQEMQYLQAVIKEGLRLHPAVGQPLEQVVPAGGATIAG